MVRGQAPGDDGIPYTQVSRHPDVVNPVLRLLRGSSKAWLDASQINRVWQAFDAALTALGRLGTVRCVDVAVPPARLAESMLHIGGIAARHGLRGASMCRAVEGIVRSVFLYDGNDPNDVARVNEAIADVARMTLEIGGVLAGEHGVGSLVTVGTSRSGRVSPLSSTMNTAPPRFGPAGAVAQGR